LPLFEPVLLEFGLDGAGCTGVRDPKPGSGSVNGLFVIALFDGLEGVVFALFGIAGSPSNGLASTRTRPAEAPGGDCIG
jgi:hypothetical protein